MLDANGRVMSEAIGSDPLADLLVAENILTDGQWHQVGLVWDGAYRTLFVDGIPVATDVLENIPALTHSLIIGTNSNPQSGTFWSGKVDDIWMYHEVIAP